MRLAFPDESASRFIAAATAMAILVLIGKLLLKGPTLPAGQDQDLLRVVYLERPRWSQAGVPPPPPQRRQPDAPPESSPDQAPPPRTVANPAPATPAARRAAAPVPAETRMVDRLYDRNSGRVRLPPQAQIDPMAKAEPAANPPGLPNERELKRAQELLYPRNPIEVESGGPFGGTWASDGTLGQQAARKLGDGLAAIGKKIFGEDIQQVRTRPPPDVGFKPQAYEQPSDLGRAETGNAYKAAPIAYEKIPGLAGEGSRRIRTALDALQKRSAACERAKVQPLLATVRSHLTELEQAEYALGHGADPVMAKQMLPRRADSAYDQARRALWYAENQLGTCAK